MAAVPMTFVGIATGDDGRSGNVTLVGMASITGLGVGGGPIIPPSDAHPEHPIVLPKPPSDAHPEHPIVIPEPPIDPPTNPPDSQGWVKPPPEGGWGYHETYQWLYNPAPGEAGPK